MTTAADTTAKPREDKTARGMQLNEEWKKSRRKGKIIFHHDGSGTVAKVSMECFVE